MQIQCHLHWLMTAFTGFIWLQQTQCKYLVFGAGFPASVREKRTYSN